MALLRLIVCDIMVFDFNQSINQSISAMIFLKFMKLYYDLK